MPANDADLNLAVNVARIAAQALDDIEYRSDREWRIAVGERWLSSCFQWTSGLWDLVICLSQSRAQRGGDAIPPENDRALALLEDALSHFDLAEKALKFYIWKSDVLGTSYRFSSPDSDDCYPTVPHAEYDLFRVARRLREIADVLESQFQCAGDHPSSKGDAPAGQHLPLVFSDEGLLKPTARQVLEALPTTGFRIIAEVASDVRIAGGSGYRQASEDYVQAILRNLTRGKLALKHPSGQGFQRTPEGGQALLRSAPTGS